MLHGADIYSHNWFRFELICVNIPNMGSWSIGFTGIPGYTPRKCHCFGKNADISFTRGFPSAFPCPTNVQTHSESHIWHIWHITSFIGTLTSAQTRGDLGVQDADGGIIRASCQQRELPRMKPEVLDPFGLVEHVENPGIPYIIY